MAQIQSASKCLITPSNSSQTARKLVLFFLLQTAAGLGAGGGGAVLQLATHRSVGRQKSSLLFHTVSSDPCDKAQYTVQCSGCQLENVI